MKATIYLEDGSKFVGDVFGYPKSVSGELVFQTGMVGYVESLTDPSYAHQFLALTYPLIGNYGVACDRSDDEKCDFPPPGFESTKIWLSALIVDRLCPPDEHSHWQATQSLSNWLKRHEVPGVAGIDVRLLTKKIREYGTLKAKLIIETDSEKSLDFFDINNNNLVAMVSRKDIKTYGNTDNNVLRVLAVDCGLKFNQIRCMLKRGCSVTVLPYNDFIDEKISDFDGLFLSNGPGDPAMCKSLINRLTKIVSSKKNKNKPIFGICLGHQLLARAIGAETHKLKYGNRGHNQPCTHADTGRCFITSQNHGFAVDAKTLPDDWLPLFTNENDGTNEGIVHTSLPYFSVQFHPEHAAGPTDMECLFDVFILAMTKAKSHDASPFCVRELITQKLHYERVYHLPVQRKVLILGSGGLSIGQAGEFDYSGAQAIKALKEQKIKTVLVNPNVATVQTSKGFADRVYFLPITKEYVTDIIKKERPTGLLCTFGGQTALNCAIELYKSGVIAQYNVSILGTPIETIMHTEDREIFNRHIEAIGERVAPSGAAKTIDEAVKVAERVGYPVLVRAAFALGGLGSGFAANRDELLCIVQQALAHSNQVLIDKSMKGWKEIEYEVVRDCYDNCITVCNMENVDPLGIHTGESVVVAPSQTLNDFEYNKLREVAIKVIRHFGIIGECNIQYALNPFSLEYYIIEVNARLSRSSALASKATGYPLAYIAAKLALGESLKELRNNVTGKTTACFEPSLDYCVVKIPRWDLSKFLRVNNRIGSSMKSVGEVMGIGRSFEEAFQKALRMVHDQYEGFSPFIIKRQTTEDDFINPTDKRVLYIARALYKGEFNVNALHDMTRIDLWFLYKMRNIIEMYKKLRHLSIKELPEELLVEAKQMGFSDSQIAHSMLIPETDVRKYRKSLSIVPFVKQIDTVAAEWPAVTNYLYLTYNGAEHDIEFKKGNRSVIVLGSGVYRIGSSVEFDACCVGCVQELKRQNYSTIMINCNPETVSTDYDVCDKLFFEEISLETVSYIYQLENPLGVILAFGGQSANNIALALQKMDLSIRVFGTSPNFIDKAEDRYKFSRELDDLEISQPYWKNATTIEEALKFVEDEVKYPCLVRPSYVLSGAAMNVADNEADLVGFLKQATSVAKDKPVVVSKFFVNAKEIDVDVVAHAGKVLVMAISEHVENAGIHSGDATLVTPPQDLNDTTKEKIKIIVKRIVERFKATGPLNMQLIAKDDKLFVIECNLRVSRSFPFVSKALDFDFVALATRAIMHEGDSSKLEFDHFRETGKVGVKVAQFSFSRLAGADVVTGVEMVSTGEVACFGANRREAYLKGLLATGFVLPQKGIFISIGSVYPKREMFSSVRMLDELGYKLYASKGTADYYKCNGVKITPIDWPFDEQSFNQYNYSKEKISSTSKTIVDYLATKDIDFMIILPIRENGFYRVSPGGTPGYRVRRMAIDNGIPLVTDLKCAKLFIAALYETKGKLPGVSTLMDCISAEHYIRLPGLIDVHCHVREPGAEHKEDWRTCTRAAVAGGVTMLLAMPNTCPALVDERTYDHVEELAAKNAYCDYGLYVGATPQNIKMDKQFAKKCAGLKMYLNDTFSALKMPSMLDWVEHMKFFPKDRPLVCHAELQTMMAVIGAAHLTNRSIHICHISLAEEICLIKKVKDSGWKVTCEVCPHHLFLTTAALPEKWQEVRPRLSNIEADCKALWDHMDYIDCFSTDHAPHTQHEKQHDGVPGFPSIQYMLPLLLTQVNAGRLTMEQLVDRLYYNPRRIFGLPEQLNTYIEVDLNEKWTIPHDGGESKCQWTPYAGWNVQGSVRTVVIRGEEVYVDGRFVTQPGSGLNVRLIADDTKNFAIEKEESVSSATPDEKDILTDRSISASPERILTPAENPFYRTNILSAEQFQDRAAVNRLLDLANRFHNDHEAGRCKFDILNSTTLAFVFYENSTRTFCSFKRAARSLNADVMRFDQEHSSISKGETFEDTIRMISCYSEGMVLRHPDVNACQRASKVYKKPIINAGDGVGEHPTQAFLDLYTIRQELSTVNGKTIALVGDLKNGRTAHSLAKILCLYKDITLHYVSPTEDLAMPESVIKYVNSHSSIAQKTFTDLLEGIRGVDVIYMTRLQKERFKDQGDYARIKGTFVLTSKLLYQASHDNDDEDDEDDIDIRRVDERPIRQTPIVMHPLPRNEEISEELDDDPRAVYFRQAQYGVYVRMALLTLMFGERH